MEPSDNILTGAAALLVMSMIRRRQKRHRKRTGRQWVKPWVQKRAKMGAYHSLIKELELSDLGSYRNFLRMDVPSFEEILGKVSPYITKEDTTMRSAIPPGERLAITLRYLATGESYTSLQYLYRVPKQTISKIVPEVCEAIYEALHDDYLKMPGTEEEWLEQAKDFAMKWNFDNCLGAMDGKHVVVRAPANTGSYFFNYKGSFSIVLLAVVDADYKFTFVDVGCNGRISDGGVFKNCSLFEMLERNNLGIQRKYKIPGSNKEVPYAFVADDAFPLKKYILKPYSQRNLTQERRIFNYRLSRARRVVENAFGILAHRFRVFLQPIALEPSKVESIVMACCTLHNFLRSKVTTPGYTDQENPATGQFHEGEWRNMPGSQGLVPINNAARGRVQDEAKDARDHLCTYMSSTGSIPWQWKMVGLE